MMGFPQRGEGNLTRATSLCKNFQPNMFNKTKCQNCFRTREAHDLDGDGGNNKPKKVLLCGYLFIAPGLDPDSPASRSRKWQRRCFILYENGELAYALDDSMNTTPQGVINMYQCITVINADSQTGQKFSLAIVTKTATTFIRAETREEKDSWLETLAEYPEINKENERMKQRQLKLAAQHAAREEKYGPAKDIPGLATSKSDSNLRNEVLNQSWPKQDGVGGGMTEQRREVLKDQMDQPRSEGLKRSQSNMEQVHPRYSEPIHLPSSSSRLNNSMSTGYDVDRDDRRSGAAKRKSDLPSGGASSRSKHADEETRYTVDAKPPTSRAAKLRSRVRASDTGISELSKSSAAATLGIQKSRSAITVDSATYSSSIHQNNNNVNYDLPSPGLGTPGDPLRRSWRSRREEQSLPSCVRTPPSSLETSATPKRSTSPRESPLSTMMELQSPVLEDAGSSSYGRERSSTNESAVSTCSQSSDDLDRLENPKTPKFRLNKDMLDGDSSSPSKRTIERHKHAHNRRARHTLDGSMHVAIPSGDESETSKDQPGLKRSNSDPNLADSDDMLKRKMIAMTFPGLFHLKKGWLIKQGDGEKDWSKHWFVLCDNKLSYYKDSSDEDPNHLDGVIDLAKCNKAAETSVTRNYGFQVELNTGIIILAAMTSGIRNNWVGAINKAIKTALEDSGKTSSPSEESTSSSSLKENKPVGSRDRKAQPNSSPLSPVAVQVEGRLSSSPLQPTRKIPNNIEPRSITQTDGVKPTISSVESKSRQSHRPESSSPSREPLSPHSVKPEGKRSATSKPTTESRPRRSSVTKEGAAHRSSATKDRANSPSSSSSEGRRNSIKEMEKHHKHPDTSSKPAKMKERRDRRNSRSGRHSQEESAAAVTAALSKRTSNTDGRSAADEQRSRRHTTEMNSGSRNQQPSGDATVIALLEQEVETLKAQLEAKQEDCAHFQTETVNLKTQLNTEQREHKESYQDLENEQFGYITQIEQMADHSRLSEVTQQKLQLELRQSKNSVQQLQLQSHQLESQLHIVTDRLGSRDQGVESLKARYAEVLQDLTDMKSDNAAALVNLKAERERSECLETELTDTWMKLRQSGVEGVDVDVVNELSVKLDEARIRLEEKEKDSVTNEGRFQKELSRLKSQHQSEIAGLQEKLQDTLRNTEELKERLAKVDQARNVPQNEPEIDSRVSKLEVLIAERDSQLKSELSAKSLLQKKYDDLVSQSAHQFLEGQGDMASRGGNDTVIQLESELDQADREIETLRKHAEAEKDQRTLLEKGFQREQALRKQLEERLSRSTRDGDSTDVEQKNAAIINLRTDLKKAKKEREVVNLVRKQLAAAVDSLHSQLSEKERALEKVSSEVETRGSQNSELKQQLQQSLSQLASLQMKVESMEIDSKQANQPFDTDAVAQLETLRSEHRQLKWEIGTIKEEHALEMHNRRSELETAETLTLKLQERIAELELKWKTAVEMVAKLENAAAARVLEWQKEEEQLRLKCERGEKEVKRLRGELHASQDNFDELELKYIQMREDVKRMELSHEEEIGQMGYRIQDLTNKLASTERKVRDLRGVDHRNRAKGGLGSAGGIGMQLSQTRQMETKLKDLESQLGDMQSTIQNQDQDTSSLLGKIVSVEQQVEARDQLPSTTSVSSVDAERVLPVAAQPLSRGSSVASAPCDSVSTSGADASEDSDPVSSTAAPDRTKQNFRARFLETKLVETELKLKEVTRKLVDVTTRELENRKAFQGKSISENRLKERLKVVEHEVAEVTQELQQARNHGDLVRQEETYREAMQALKRSHNLEIKALEEEKEQELEEERKATATTIALVQRAHTEELANERLLLQQIRPLQATNSSPLELPPSKKDKSNKQSKPSKLRAAGMSAIHRIHKQELEQQKLDLHHNVSNDVEAVMKRHREVITKMDRDWKIISDKFTRVCAENTSLGKQLGSLKKALTTKDKELECWQRHTRELTGRNSQDMEALRERISARLENSSSSGEEEEEDWIVEVDGNDNERNPLKVLLRFREAELQCTNNELKNLRVALEEAEKERTSALEHGALLEGLTKSQEECIRNMQQQFDRVRTSGEGEAAHDDVVSVEGGVGGSGGIPSDQGGSPTLSSVGSGDGRADTKLRSWIPFLKKERSDSAGKGSRRRSGSEGILSSTKKKGATATE